MFIWETFCYTVLTEVPVVSLSSKAKYEFENYEKFSDISPEVWCFKKTQNFQVSNAYFYSQKFMWGLNI